MNSLILLSLGLGLASGSLMSMAGEEHVFSYHGRLLTGFPEVATHFSGVTIDCDVIIQAMDDTNFKLGLKNVSYTKFDQKLNGPDPLNWRTLQLPTPTPLDNHVDNFLHIPISFTSKEGTISNIVVSELDLAWSINFKKALVSLFKIHLPSLAPSAINNEDSYKVMEEGVDGICETTYKVTELNDMYVKDLKAQGLIGLIDGKFCQKKKVFQIEKTRDTSNCEKVNVYLSSQKKDKNMLTRTSTTKYLGCGNNMRSMKLLGVYNEGELHQNILSFHTENLVTGTKQVLKLNEINQLTILLPEILNPTSIPNLFYDFPHAANKTPQKSLLAEIKSSEDFQQNLAINFLKDEIYSKLKSTAMGLLEVDDIEERTHNSNLLSVSTIFPLLSAEDLKSLFNQIQLDPTIDKDIRESMLSLYIDVAIMCGHSSSIQFLKYVVQTQTISYTTLLTIAMTMGHNLKVPNMEVLDLVFSIIKSPVIYDNKVIRNIALLNFANFLNKACIDPSRNIRFPSHIFSDFCSPKSSEITDAYIPYILNAMRNTDDQGYKGACLFALGTIGHESVPPLLIPYIEGKVKGSNIGLRMLSIWSLANFPEPFHHILVPVFSAMLDNPAEIRDIRIASFVMMVKMKPSISFMQKMAILTWHEKDLEVAQFIFSALKSLSEMELEVGSMKEISAMSRTVLPLAKPLPGKIFLAEELFANEWLDGLGVGLETTTAFWTNPDGNNFYKKVTKILSKIQITPLEMAANFQGFKTLVEQLKDTAFEVMTGKSSSEDPMTLVHSDWKKIIQNLNFTAREDPPFFGQLYVNIFEDMMAQVGVDQHNLDALKQKLKSLMYNPSTIFDQVCGRNQINFSKAVDIMPVEALIPSEMGFPIIVEIHTPHLISVQGHIDVNCNMNNPTVETSIKVKSVCNIYGLTGTISPLTSELVVTGIEEQRSINIPIKTVLGVDQVGKKLNLKISPLVTPTTNFVDLINHHITPFTVVKPVTDLAPLVFHPNRKTIHSSAPTEVMKKLGDDIGFEVTYKLSTESQIVNGQSILEELDLYKKNPINMFLFRWTSTAHKLNGLPSIRPHMFRIRYEPTKSTNNEIELQGSISTGDGLKSEDYTASTKIKLSLLGNSPKTFSLQANGGFETFNNEAKWTFDLSTSKQNVETFKMCTKSSLKQPEIELWNIRTLAQQATSINFTHSMKFGNRCTKEETTIKAVASVSDNQKNLSQNSAESILCRSSKHLACHKQLDQAHTLDEVVVTMSGSTVSKVATFYDQYLSHFANSFFWSYINPSVYPLIPFSADEVIIKLNFHKKLNTVSMVLITPLQSVLYENIRLPESMPGLLPLVAGKGIAETIYEAETDTPILPTCHLTETNHMIIHTFDRRAYPYELDDCYHVITSDCSKRFTNAVLAKAVAGMKHVKIYHMITSIEMKPSVSYTPEDKDYIILVDGTVYSIQRNTKRPFHSADGTNIYVISRSLDDVITVETPDTVVMYDGNHLDVKSKLVRATGQLCGLCGDGNQDDRFDLRTPHGCIYSLDQTAALTYRLQDSQCSPLPLIQQDLLSNEKKQCIKYGEKTRPRLLDQPRNCTSLKHSIMRKEGPTGDICVSNDPIVECRSGCTIDSLIFKDVTYSCLPFNNQNRKYLQESLILGDKLEEIRKLGKPFVSRIQTPSSCV